jgi:hypothetical protein
MRPKIIVKQLTALDRDGISAAQTTAGAADLTIEGALASDGVATLDTQRIVGIYSGGNLSGVVFTVYGTNSQGIPISETITGPNNTTVSGVLMFKTVTRVAVDAAVGTNVEVGTTGVGATQPIPLDQHISPFAIGLFGEVETGLTVNYTVQYTPDAIQDITKINSAVLGVPGIKWTAHSSLTSKTASADSNIAYPAAAVRLLINSGTDPVTLIVRQAGL